MPSTASTVISTVVDYGRFIGLGLALILALATILVGFVGTFGPHWAFALMTVVAWNVLTVFQGFIEYIHLRRDMENVDWYFKHLKIRIPAEKTLGWFPWWETIIVISLALWFWHPFYAAILTLCILVLYSYTFLDLLQKRLEEIYEVSEVMYKQMDYFLKLQKFQEESGDFYIVDDVEVEEEAGNSKSPINPKVDGVFKNPFNWSRCMFLIGVLLIESQWIGWDYFAVLFLAYNFHQTNINAEVEKIKMIFTGYDEEVLECLKDIKKFQRSRKN
ncbi:hypothetical protein L3Y34_016513 [Caenorhabditis briggsae]|uniref:Uncharacterized protein n=1 Tax=Caenorhabditis briggsae TaxID=6238 RepID=A0AAE9DZI6_CAEBR|nr:hypothetical protein L3Y34_016513 [Caenorhabditis briggsae]